MSAKTGRSVFVTKGDRRARSASVKGSTQGWLGEDVMGGPYPSAAGTTICGARAGGAAHPS